MTDEPDSAKKAAAVAQRVRAAAERALAEAEERRKLVAETPSRPRERGGRDGPEPVRYGDWEVKGIASDF